MSALPDVLITSGCYVGEIKVLLERLPRTFPSLISDFDPIVELCERDREFCSDPALGTHLDNRLRDMARPGPFIKDVRRALSLQDAHKVLCGNAARLYGFDLHYLVSHRPGFEV